MTLYFTPGPVELFPQVKDWISDLLAKKNLSISHRSKYFEQINFECKQNLRDLFGLPRDYQIFFLASATEAFERILQNTCEKFSFHVVNGAFSRRFYQTACQYHKVASLLEFELGKASNISQMVIPPNVELVCLTHNETSTGVRIPENQMRERLGRETGMLTAVDVVSSAPFFDVSCSGFLPDILFFSVQKCFGLPSGLAILCVSPKALSRARELEAAGGIVGSYHRFSELCEFASKNQTPETPNMLGVYLLNSITQYFLSLGMKRLREALTERMKQLHECVLRNAKLSWFVQDEVYRSETVGCVAVEGGAEPLVQYLKSKEIEVGSGYGPLKDHCVRIANFPMFSDEQFETMIRHLGSF